MKFATLQLQDQEKVLMALSHSYSWAHLTYICKLEIDPPLTKTVMSVSIKRLTS